MVPGRGQGPWSADTAEEMAVPTQDGAIKGNFPETRCGSGRRPFFPAPLRFDPRLRSLFPLIAGCILVPEVSGHVGCEGVPGLAGRWPHFQRWGTLRNCRSHGRAGVAQAKGQVTLVKQDRFVVLKLRQPQNPVSMCGGLGIAWTLPWLRVVQIVREDWSPHHLF